MKKLLLLLFFIYFCRVLSLSLLADIKFERFEVAFLNKSYAKVKLGTNMLNRTTRTFHAQFVMFKPLDKYKAKLSFKFEKFVSNEYRLGAIQYSDTVYNMMSSKYNGVDSGVITAKYCLPYNLSWPLLVGRLYKCKNIMPDRNYFFSIFEGKWKVIMAITNEDDNVLETHIYSSIEMIYQNATNN